MFHKKMQHFNFRSKEGMTLVELLIGIAVSSVIMIATITLVNYSFSAYTQVQSNISSDAGLYDATDIVNRYIRESDFCSVKNETTLYLSISDYSSDATLPSSKDVRFIYDESKDALLLDMMNGSSPLVIAQNIIDVKWEICGNTVKYHFEQRAPQTNMSNDIRGFAYCRGR